MECKNHQEYTINIIQKNWIEFYGYEDDSYVNLYLESIYFNVVTMITVGYGDIYPTSIYVIIIKIGMKKYFAFYSWFHPAYNYLMFYQHAVIF